jgi:hypothetical protein
MSTRDSIAFAIAASALFLHTSIPAAADSIASPSTHETVSGNQQFVFVMVPPISLDDELKTWNEDFGAKIRKIRAVHGISGLYRNDGTPVPLWTVDWYAYAVEIYSDGVHLIRHGPWASRMTDEAITFFAQSRLIKKYRVSDLVKDRRKLERTVSHFNWSIDSRLDDDALRYTLITVDHRCYVFDATTGEIISVTSRRKLP